MYLPTILACLFAITAYAIPLAHRQRPTDLACADPGDCYKIQSLNVTTGKQVELSFTIYDDGKSSDNETLCSTSWEAGTNSWPQNYIKCDEDWFQWEFSKFDSITDWVMEAAKDFRLGDFGARAFANGTAVSNDFVCQGNATEAQRCSLKADHVINLVKYAMIA